MVQVQIDNADNLTELEEHFLQIFHSGILFRFWLTSIWARHVFVKRKLINIRSVRRRHKFSFLPERIAEQKSKTDIEIWFIYHFLLKWNKWVIAWAMGILAAYSHSQLCLPQQKQVQYNQMEYAIKINIQFLFKRNNREWRQPKQSQRQQQQNHSGTADNIIVVDFQIFHIQDANKTIIKIEKQKWKYLSGNHRIIESSILRVMRLLWTDAIKRGCQMAMAFSVKSKCLLFLRCDCGCRCTKRRTIFHRQASSLRMILVCCALCGLASNAISPNKIHLISQSPWKIMRW